MGRQDTLEIPKGVPVPPGAKVLPGGRGQESHLLAWTPLGEGEGTPCPGSSLLRPALTSEGSLEDLVSSTTKLHHSRAEERSRSPRSSAFLSAGWSVGSDQLPLVKVWVVLATVLLSCFQ